MSIGNRLVRLREQRGWTQAELARRAHVAQSTVNRLELHNDAGARSDVLARLAVALEVSVAELFPTSGEALTQSILFGKSEVWFPRTRRFLAEQFPSPLSLAQLDLLDSTVEGNLRAALSLLSAAGPAQPTATAMPSGDTTEPAHGSVNWPSRTMGRLWSGAMQRIKVAGRATVLARPVAALEG